MFKSFPASYQLVLFYLFLLILMKKKNDNVKNTFDVYYHNATSIRGKLFEFNNFFSEHDQEAICITETWLNDSVCDGEILDNVNYTVFRNDRDLTRTKKRDGGGVLCAVKSEYISYRGPILNHFTNTYFSKMAV